jgi:hypothetical protein
MGQIAYIPPSGRSLSSLARQATQTAGRSHNKVTINIRVTINAEMDARIRRQTRGAVSGAADHTWISVRVRGRERRRV